MRVMKNSRLVPPPTAAAAMHVFRAKMSLLRARFAHLCRSLHKRPHWPRAMLAEDRAGQAYQTGVSPPRPPPGTDTLFFYAA